MSAARFVAAFVAASLVLTAEASAWETPAGAATVTLDLTKPADAAVVAATWRHSEARIVPAEFFAPGADGQPGSARSATYDIEPRAGVRGFDDSAWPVVPADELARRQGGGLLSFQWYRARLTLPERVGAFATRGATVVLDVTVDDYAEVWVDGELARGAGQSGGSVIAGWNTPNRVVLARNASPGRQIELAVFGANGPLSSPPTNYVWFREARLDLYPGAQGPVALPEREVTVRVERHDAEIDRVLSHNPKAFKLAEGFIFTEGPVWVPEGRGHLLFSDPNANAIYRYVPSAAVGTAGALSVFRTPSGYSGADVAEYGQPGSNGLTLDARRRLTMNEHGNHRVVRLESDGRESELAASYDGKRLNSPNDLVYRSDGALYFTDPPFGLPKFFADPRRELDFSGVYLLKDDRLTLLTRELTGPNGIALSPDERTLYVGNWDEQRKVVLRFVVRPDGTTGPSDVFFDLTSVPGPEAIDGIKVDVEGRVYVAGPGGIFVVARDGRHLGTIVLPAAAHNFAFGDSDGKSLYVTAEGNLYRVPLRVAGVRPGARSF
jgi:gluconolactonase